MHRNRVQAHTWIQVPLAEVWGWVVDQGAYASRPSHFVSPVNSSSWARGFGWSHRRAPQGARVMRDTWVSDPPGKVFSAGDLSGITKALPAPASPTHEARGPRAAIPFPTCP